MNPRNAQYEIQADDGWFTRMKKRVAHVFIEPEDPTHTKKRLSPRLKWKRVLAPLSIAVGAGIVGLIGIPEKPNYVSPLAPGDSMVVTTETNPLEFEDFVEKDTTLEEKMFEPVERKIEVAEKKNGVKKPYLLQKQPLLESGVKEIGKDSFLADGKICGNFVEYDLEILPNDSVVYGVTILKEKDGKFYNTDLNFLVNNKGVLKIPKKVVDSEDKLRLFAGIEKDDKVSFLESVKMELKYSNKKERGLIEGLLRNDYGLNENSKTIESVIGHAGSGSYFDLEKTEENYGNGEDIDKIKRIKNYVNAGIKSNVGQEKIVSRFNAEYASDLFWETLRDMYVAGVSNKEIAEKLSGFGMNISVASVAKYGNMVTGAEGKKKAREKYKGRVC